ncbi:hypothetical protein Desmu_0718 [Desulfurococcus mucosus DSM 2162]|uniref:Uncharacterized protein n=1 Tax=Desulfurococcus mucosus (strain ATCC 35584 / DSM 2162 / JCM 9187 / O7/1) TaxID=765177 RepID=E8R948_DESM0|nr:hypothetical protein [Desulfurococcus mucosus]ADV65024.1 hypothetical protein Desmu_0718 [Desulfurococcus mucosus DSM 2162]
MRALPPLILLLLVVLSSPGLIHVSAQEAPGRLIYIYFPGSDGQRVAGVLREIYGNSTPISFYSVEPEQGGSPLYYLYWMTTGARPAGSSTIPQYGGVNQSTVLILWNNTALVGNPLVDPSIHPYAYNPLYNLSGNYIPPRIISVKANNSFHWDEIDSDVRLNLSGSVLSIEVVKQGYTWTLNTTQSRELAPPRIFVLLNETRFLSAGNYTITFYVIRADPENITLFFPGSVRMDIGAGSGVSGIISHTTPWSIIDRDLFTRLPSDAAAWWLQQSVLTLGDVTRLAAGNVNVSVTLVYMPHLVLLKNLTGGVTSPDMVDAVYNGFKLVAASLITTYRDAAIVVFDTGEAGRPGYLAIAKGSVQQANISLTSSQLVAFILAGSSLTPLGYSNLLNLLQQRKLEIGDLNVKVNELNNTVTSMNQTINELTGKLATCSSENTLLNSRITQVNAELEKAKALYTQAYTYITLGLATTIAVSVALGYIAILAARKKP